MKNKKHIAELHRVKGVAWRIISASRCFGTPFLSAPQRYILLITSLLIFASQHNSHAQYRKLDSLKTALQNHPQQDLKHLQLLQLIAEAQEWAITKDGIVTADKAISLAKKLNNKKELAAAYTMKARLVIYDMELDKASQILDSAFSINFSINDQKGLADNYLVRGIENNLRADYVKFKNMLDSANMLIKPFNDIQLKGRIEYNYGNYYALSDVDSSNYHFNRSLKLFEQIADSAWQANALTFITRNLINIRVADTSAVRKNTIKIRSLLLPGYMIDQYTLELVWIAQHLSTHSNYDLAIEYLTEALPYATKANNELYLQYVYFNLAMTYQNIANFPLALKYYHQSLKISENMHDEFGIAAALANMGIIYRDMKDYTTALKYMLQSDSIGQKIGNEYQDVCLLQELADLYIQINRFADAKNTLKVCLKKSIEINAKELMAVSYGHFGNLYAKTNNPDSAFYCFNKAAALNKEMGVVLYLAKNLLSMSRTIKDLPALEATDLMKKVFNPNQKFDKAIEYANEALHLVKQSGELDLQRDAYQLLSELYEKKNDDQSALKYYKQFALLKDSIANSENIKSIQGIKIQYDSEKQEQQITSLQKDKVLHQSEINKNKTQRNILMGGCTLVLVFIGFIVNAYISKTKSNKEIEKTLEHLQTTQQQLVQQGKLAALGKMTSDVAHRIKDPIGKIKTLSPQGEQLVKQYENLSEETEKNFILQQLKTNLIEINNNGVTANEIVKDVLAQTRKQTG